MSEEIYEEIVALETSIRAMKKTVKRLRKMAAQSLPLRTSLPPSEWATLYRREAGGVVGKCENNV